MIRPGDLVRHKGTGRFSGLKGRYGLVQVISEADGWLGIEWGDLSPADHSDAAFGLYLGNNLDGILRGRRRADGFWVSPDDVKVL
jgi:hypothetical protein